MASASLHVNDPVYVTRDSKQDEGVVAYIGSVQFDAGADDWVGVRLTGSSVGLGKNDGSVQGITYFTCPPNCGVFAKASAITARSLNRLEALRLKREMAKQDTETAAAAGTTTTTASATPSRTPSKVSSRTPPPPSAVATTAADTSTTAPSNAPAESSTTSPIAAAASSRRLEELRKRRAALQDRKAEPTGPTVAPDNNKAEPVGSSMAANSSQTSLVDYDDNNEKEQGSLRLELNEIKELLEGQQKETAELKEQLRVNKLETASLQQQLSQTEQQAHDAKSRINELMEQLEQQASATTEPSSSHHQAADPHLTELIVQEKDQELYEQSQVNRELQDQLDGMLREMTNLKRDLEREKENRAADQEALTKARTRTSTLEKELQALADQSTQRGAADASHYKERAKLQAEVMSVKRVVEQLEKEKLELENSIEDLTLDKEQLQEEKEALEERYEEARLDLEAAQIQVDELRMELEDAQLAAQRSASLPAETAASAESMDAEDKAQALAIQNGRLREALIRLREQSSVDKMEAARQLRAAEKDAETGKALISEVESLRSLKANMEEQINDLKDMVEQGSAFEVMVEDLSDRVMALEEDNILLRSTIREMEEAVELTEEMEEVQAEEMKALVQDLEGRDTIIRNLEEAIKMQRRREEDFRRTVGNYRTTVDTLKMEKQALLELQAGGEGEKSSLIASSQKALARAAQLVADAAEVRKREARAVVDKIDRQIYRHLSTRLESLLPRNYVASEVAAVKGELLAAKVISKAAQSLITISKAFDGSIRPPIPDDGPVESSATPLRLSDEMKAELEVIFHQTEFAQELSEVSSKFMRFLAAGQWPDLMSADASGELGSLLGHTLLELDSELGQVLQTLKEEGSLTFEQSNIDLVRQAARNAVQSLKSDLERKDGALVSPDWTPPGLNLMKDVSISKFCCLGAAAGLSSVIHSPEKSVVGVALKLLYGRVEQCSSLLLAISLRLASLDVRNSHLVKEIELRVTEVTTESRVLLQTVKDALLSSGDVKTCDAAVDKTLSELAKLSAVLRSSGLHQNDDGSYHSLSPESDDTWQRLSKMAQELRAVDGDIEDVNFAIRARQVEHRLDNAVVNEPKLEMAQSKIATLEKNIASRSKEIAIQNARLSELERLLAKSSASTAGRGHSADFKSSEEYNRLNEENRVLLEAMDVLQRQVDEYEHEIRVLKDFKAPSKRGAQGGRASHSTRTTRRSVTSITDPSSSRAGSEEPSDSYSLEATIFRPALQQALRDSWKWKAAATSTAMFLLPPLPVPFNDNKGPGDLIQLSSAISDVRLHKASIRMVDLRNTAKTPRAQLQETRIKCLEASRRLETQVRRSQAQQ